MIESIGYIGAAALSLCGLPAAYHSIKNGTVEINSGMLWMWLLGEIFTLIYVVNTTPSIPLIANYTANIILLSIITKYKYFPRKNAHPTT